MSTTITLAPHRLDGGTGVCLSTNGILLAKGALLPANVGTVALWVNGAEVACYVEALSGRHGDGSVIAVLVQANLNPATVTSAELRIGTAAVQSRLTKTTVPVPYGAACLLPSSSSDWLTNTVLLSAPSRASTPAPLQAFDTNWDGWETLRRTGAAPYTDKWDRTHGYVGQIARAPSHANVVEWYKVACTVARNYVAGLDASFTANGYANNPGQSTISLGLGWYYWLSGDEYARFWLGREAVNQFGTYTNPQWLYPDGRINHYNILSGAIAALTETTGDDPYNGHGPYTRAQWVTGLNALITTAMAEQVTVSGVGPIAASQGGVSGVDEGGNSNVGWWFLDPNGAVGDEGVMDPPTHVLYYAAGMIATALVQVIELVPELSTRRADVLATVKTMCDAAIALGANVWDATSKQFKYSSTGPWPPLPNGGTWFVAVNPWLAEPFAWVYRETGDATYLTYADKLFQGMVSRIGTPGSGTYGAYTTDLGSGDLTTDEQAFNQYAVGWPYLGFRQSAGGSSVATQLLLSTPPAGALAGQPLPQQPVIAFADAGGSTVTSETTSVTASLVVTSGSVTPTGTLTKAAVAGLATFTDLGFTGTLGSVAHWRYTAGAFVVDGPSFTVLTSLAPSVL